MEYDDYKDCHYLYIDVDLVENNHCDHYYSYYFELNLMFIFCVVFSSNLFLQDDYRMN